MSLTDDWKAGKLENGKSYYVKMHANGDIKILQALDDKEDGQVLGDSKFIYTPCEIPEIYDIEEVLTPVPSYEELQQMKENLKDHKENCCCLENEKLRLDKANLRSLLKECKEFFEEENPKDFTVISERMDYLLTRINAIIGESEE